MTPAFRNIVLLADDGIEEKYESFVRRGKDEEFVDDNTFHQLQWMFAHLLISDKKAFDPARFCFTYKLFGQRVNVCK